MSIGGCYLGFRVEQWVFNKKGEDLRKDVSRLERELELAIQKRMALEREVERLMSVGMQRPAMDHCNAA